jgi:hypothetical protein
VRDAEKAKEMKEEEDFNTEAERDGGNGEKPTARKTLTVATTALRRSAEGRLEAGAT